MRNRWAFGALAAVVLAACNPPAPAQTSKSYPVVGLKKDGKVVAQIGPVALTTKELEARVASQSPMAQARLRQEGELERWVEAEVKGELLAQEAFDRGLFEDPEVQRILRQSAVRVMMQDELERMDSEVTVTEDEMAANYKERFEEFNKPERARFGALPLELETEEEAKKKLAEFEAIAKDVRAQQKKGNMNAFDEEARKFTGKYELDRTSVDLGFMTQSTAADTFGEENAKTLFEGTTVGDVKALRNGKKVWLVKKTGYRRPTERSYEDVKQSIRGRLRAEKRQEMVNAWIDEIAKKRGVDLTIENVDAIDIGSNPQPAQGGVRPAPTR